MVVTLCLEEAEGVTFFRGRELSFIDELSKTKNHVALINMRWFVE